MTPERPRLFHGLSLAILSAALASPAPRLPAQSDKARPPDLARTKEEEAREKMERLEESMDRLSRLLAASEPQNAAKLKLAFREARDRLVREGMDRIVKYLEDRKLDRAIEEGSQVKVNLEEILTILLERDVDPRELLKHIRRLRDVVTGLDKVIKDETGEKMASDDAEQAGASSEALSKDLAKLEDLIQRERKIESSAKDPSNANKDALGKLAEDQGKVKADTKALREGDEKRAETPKPPPAAAPKPAEEGREKPGDGNAEGKPSEGAAEGKPSEGGKPGQPGEGAPPKPGEGAPQQPGEGQQNPDGSPRQPAEEPPPPPAQPESVLEKKALARAEDAMAQAEGAMQKTDAKTSAAKASEAREALESAVKAGAEKLERLRQAREFEKMKADQDATKKDTTDIAEKMQTPTPLVGSPEEGVPGQKEVQSAAGDMESASGDLGQGQPRKSSRSQKKAVQKLQAGREKTEEALEELQRALRDRILAYLREKFTRMLNDQRLVTNETHSLDLKVRALQALKPAEDVQLERKDRQLCEALATREGAISLIAGDVLDLLAEDGTTLVFPGVVEELQRDLGNVQGLLSRIQTGDRTQHIQKEIERGLEEILKALEVAAKSPPPPNPNQGRSSKSGAGPLLPMSSELKMVRALQARVNERTQAFDLSRKPESALSPEEKLQVDAIAKKQAEVETMMGKLKRAMREE